METTTQHDIDPELEFISGKIFDINLPKEWLFLHQYFRSAAGHAFVKYFFIYRRHNHFSSHTGYSLSRKLQRQYRRRFLQLEKAYIEAKEKGDFEVVVLLENGKYSVDF